MKEKELYNAVISVEDTSDFIAVRPTQEENKTENKADKLLKEKRGERLFLSTTKTFKDLLKKHCLKNNITITQYIEKLVIDDLTK